MAENPELLPRSSQRTDPAAYGESCFLSSSLTYLTHKTEKAQIQTILGDLTKARTMQKLFTNNVNRFQIIPQKSGIS